MSLSRGMEFATRLDISGRQAHLTAPTAPLPGRPGVSYLELGGAIAAPPQPIHTDPDVPADDTTTVDLAIGGSYDGELEVLTDHDWIRVELTAGTIYEFSLNGSGASPLSDPYLRLYDAAGNQVTYNDNGGPGLNSLLRYTAEADGIYYIDVGAYSDGYAGTYTVTAEVSPPLEVFSYEQIADFLSTGYWGTTGPVHWNLSGGDILTVNLTGLTAGEVTVARMALDLWTDVTGLIFEEVSSDGMLVFDNEFHGAYASFGRDSNNVITSATINISETWLSVPTTQLYSYWLQTYIHEIGHVLGLGHGGNYNGSADYSVDAHYLNDSHQASIMSYFWPSQNTWLDADFLWTLTPQMADILAVQSQYGVPTTTRAGNTVYGFNSTAGRDVFDATLFSLYNFPSVTIFDSGGTDTLDYSGFAVDQVIDLAAGGISSVGGMTGNLLIALNTVIERAAGGAGDDTISGNDANNILWGNAGDDTINGLGGADYLVGGDGADTLSGGDGADILDGGSGADIIYGDDGDDRLFGRDGADELTGGLGADILVGGDGDDILNGQAGDDRIRGGNDNDTIDGGGGADIIYGQNGDDEIWGGAGADFIQGGLDNDGLHGGDDNDRLGGGGGDDILFGDAGDDIATGNGGNDTFTGGAGDDRFTGGGGQEDRAVYSGNFSDYQLTYFASSNQVRIVDLRDGSPDGTDTLFTTEILAFADGVVGVNGGAFDFNTSQTSQENAAATPPVMEVLQPGEILSALSSALSRSVFIDEDGFMSLSDNPATERLGGPVQADDIASYDLSLPTHNLNELSVLNLPFEPGVNDIKAAWGVTTAAANAEWADPIFDAFDPITELAPSFDTAEGW